MSARPRKQGWCPATNIFSKIEIETPLDLVDLPGGQGFPPFADLTISSGMVRMPLGFGV
jgi:hypothetical protein